MNAIKLLDCDPAWPGLFEDQKLWILESIADIVDDIHHVGSTSVAGLSAKPEIDIDAVLHSDAGVTEAVLRTLMASTTLHVASLPSEH
jgi:GrpB-like predicted nucleotidyltransferase (UPF0157 family)